MLRIKNIILVGCLSQPAHCLLKINGDFPDFMVQKDPRRLCAILRTSGYLNRITNLPLGSRIDFSHVRIQNSVVSKAMLMPATIMKINITYLI
jgi:hypothetical protein